MKLDGATFLLQWATGGLAFLWVTTRRREVSLGYGWLLRGVFGVMAIGAVALFATQELTLERSLALAAAIGVVAAAVFAGGPYALAALRLLVGAAFLGAISDAMLLGHWYLVQPGLRRDALKDLVRWTAIVWPFEVAVFLWPIGMVQVIDSTVSDGYHGLLGWIWIACAVTTIALIGLTWLALKERYYSAVMAATGLLYLAILTAFGTDLIARAVLRP